MRCAHCSHLSTLDRCINWPRRLFKESMRMFQYTSARTFQVFSQQCLTRTHPRGQISIKSSSSHAFQIGSRNSWMKKISKMNFHTPSCIIKTYLTNSKLFKPGKKQRKKNKRNKRPKKQKLPLSNRKILIHRWLRWNWVITSQSMVRIQHSLTRCIWITLTDFSRTIIMDIPPKLVALVLSPTDHILSKVLRRVLMVEIFLRLQSITLTVTRTQNKKAMVLVVVTENRWKRWAARINKWSTYPLVNLQNLKNTWFNSMGLLSSNKASESSSKIEI